jgi:hypothetical protein
VEEAEVGIERAAHTLDQLELLLGLELVEIRHLVRRSG